MDQNKYKTSKFFTKLDPGQLKAVTSQNKHILCLAGAGSGKTRVLTSRIYYLVNKLGISSDNILAITFTKNAANEMVKRLNSLKIDTNKLWCRTFHSVCYRILSKTNQKKPLNIINEAKQDSILKYIIKKLSENKDFGYKMARFKEENNWPDYLFYEEIAKIIHECKNYSISLKNLIKRCRKNKDEDIREFYRLFYVIYYKYCQLMLQNKFYDFSDLIIKVIKLLENTPKILKYYQNKFKYILVDEFQDVNYPQVKLISLLKGRNNNLFAVGDDWQSIYGWRGSDVNFILKFKKIFREDSQVITLPYNYRSDSNIVNAASKFIRKNKYRCRKKIKSFHPKSFKIRIFSKKNEKENLSFVAKTIKKLLDYKIPEDEIMILGRNWKNLDIYIKNLPEFGFKNIKINTIHGSKGLESDIVFLVGLYKGRSGFPYIKEDHEIMKVIKKTPLKLRLEEERRCFYVGLTRARKLLFLITEKGNESRFIREIPRRYCKEVGH